jgi:hypothetical protein
MRTIKEVIEKGGDLTLGERFDLWELRDDKDVMDFPIGDLTDAQYHIILDGLDITKKILVIGNEIVLVGGLCKSEDFPYIVVEVGLDGGYRLFQVDNKNDWGNKQYKVLKRYPYVAAPE